ncbi:MAG: polysaccharide biosynthesis C-terminal domain-containing protein, partial [Elusimicrobiota bacterium]
QVFWEVLLPSISGFYGNGDDYRARRTYYLACRYIAFLSWPIGIAGIVLAYPFLHYVYGHEFVRSENVLQILFFASIIVSLDSPSGALFFAMEKQSLIIKFSAILAFLNIVMDILLIPRYGALGAAFCNGTVQIIGSIIGLIYIYKVFNYAYPIKSISKIAFSSLFMGVVMLVIVKTDTKISGFIMALLIGPFIYLISCIVLGSFENEDLEILNKCIDVAPRPVSKVIKEIIKYVMQQKLSDKKETF